MIPSRTPRLTRADAVIAFTLGVLALALYVRTLAPSLLWGDSAEFQTLSYTLGMTHPSGYMTYVLIGKLFTLIPWGNIAWRVNLMSAFFGALAVALAYLIGRLLHGRPVALIAASIVMATNEGYWWRALIAESYATAAGFVAAIWLLVLLWQRYRRPFSLFLAGWLGGLSVGIHSTVVMTAVPVLASLGLARPGRRDGLAAILGALLGLACTLAAFLYVDAHDPPSSIYNTVYRPSLSEFGLTPEQFDTPWERLLLIFPANRFWTYYFSAPSEEIQARLVEFVGLFPRWAAILIGIGMVVIFWQAGLAEGIYPLLGFGLIWGLAVTVSFSIYREFYVPAMVFVAVWLGIGGSALLEGLDRLFGRLPTWGPGMKRIGVGAMGVLLVGLSLWGARSDLGSSVFRGYPEFVRRYHVYPIFAPHKAIQEAQRVLKRLEPNAILFTEWDTLYSLVYTAQVEGVRPDVHIHAAFVNERYRVADSALEYIDAHLGQQAVYFTVLTPLLTERYRVETLEANLFRLYPRSP